mgnify:CR=1 FL=1
MHLLRREIVPVLQILMLAWPGSYLFSRFGRFGLWGFIFFGRVDNCYGATGRFDLFPGRFAECVGRDIEFLGQLAVTQYFDSGFLLAQYSGFKQAVGCHLRAWPQFLEC